MKHHWLIKKSRQKLLIFFAGWSMDYNPFNHLKSSEYDVLMFYNYTDLSIDNLLKDEWTDYGSVDLICWSMGVWVANYFKDYLDNIRYSIAVNGTFYPIHNSYGIPKNMFRLTLKHFSLENRERFYRNMFTDKDEAEKFLKVQPQRDWIEQKEELIALQKHITSCCHCDMPISKDNFEFSKVIISENDKIIPAKNQLNYWREGVMVQSGNISPSLVLPASRSKAPPEYCQISQESPSIIINQSGHYPFFLWDKWEDILEYAG